MRLNLEYSQIKIFTGRKEGLITEVKLKIWKEGFVDEIFFDKNSTVENLPRLEKLLDVQESDFLSLFQEENEVVIEGNIIAMMNGNEIIKYDFKKKYEFMDNNGNILNMVNEEQLELIETAENMFEKAMIYISDKTKWIAEAFKLFSISLKILKEKDEYNKQELISYLRENR